jgi:hypothetical protein
MGKVIEKVKLTSLFDPEKSMEIEAVIDKVRRWQYYLDIVG